MMLPEHATQRTALLALLQEGGEPTNVDLQRVGGLKYGGRVSELRAAGHLVKCLPPRKGEGRLYRYRYMGQQTSDEIRAESKRDNPHAWIGLGCDSPFAMQWVRELSHAD